MLGNVSSPPAPIHSRPPPTNDPLSLSLGSFPLGEKHVQISLTYKSKQTENKQKKIIPLNVTIPSRYWSLHIVSPLSQSSSKEMSRPHPLTCESLLASLQYGTGTSYGLSP